MKFTMSPEKNQPSQEESSESEKELEVLQNQAILFEQEKLQPEQAEEFKSLAQKYIENHTETVTCYNDFGDNYVYLKLPNNLYIEARTHYKNTIDNEGPNYDDYFFSKIITQEEAEKKMKELEKSLIRSCEDADIKYEEEKINRLKKQSEESQ